MNKCTRYEVNANIGFNSYTHLTKSASLCCRSTGDEAEEASFFSLRIGHLGQKGVKIPCIVLNKLTARLLSSLFDRMLCNSDIREGDSDDSGDTGDSILFVVVGSLSVLVFVTSLVLLLSVVCTF